MRIVFIGPPGAGKGTQAERLIDTYQLAHLSTGDMLRAARDAQTDVGRKADEYMSSGQLVPDVIIVAIIRERLEQPDCQKGYLLDGFPRTIAQAEALDAMLAEKDTPLDVVLELRVPEEELFKRLAGRGRADDTPEVIRQRLSQVLDTLLTGNCFLRSLSGAGICASALTADRQAATVPNTPVAANIAQTNDILICLPSQLPFDDVVLIQ